MLEAKLVALVISCLALPTVTSKTIIWANISSVYLRLSWNLFIFTTASDNEVRRNTSIVCAWWWHNCKKPALIRKTDLLAFRGTTFPTFANVLEFGPRIVLRKVRLLFSLIVITAWLDFLYLASSVFSLLLLETRAVRTLNLFILYPGKKSILGSSDGFVIIYGFLNCLLSTNAQDLVLGTTSYGKTAVGIKKCSFTCKRYNEGSIMRLLWDPQDAHTWSICPRNGSGFVNRKKLPPAGPLLICCGC